MASPTAPQMAPPIALPLAQLVAPPPQSCVARVITDSHAELALVTLLMLRLGGLTRSHFAPDAFAHSPLAAKHNGWRELWPAARGRAAGAGIATDRPGGRRRRRRQRCSDWPGASAAAGSETRPWHGAGIGHGPRSGAHCAAVGGLAATGDAALAHPKPCGSASCPPASLDSGMEAMCIATCLEELTLSPLRRDSRTTRLAPAAAAAATAGGDAAVGLPARWRGNDMALCSGRGELKSASRSALPPCAGHTRLFTLSTLRPAALSALLRNGPPSAASGWNSSCRHTESDADETPVPTPPESRGGSKAGGAAAAIAAAVLNVDDADTLASKWQLPSKRQLSQAAAHGVRQRFRVQRHSLVASIWIQTGQRSRFSRAKPSVRAQTAAQHGCRRRYWRRRVTAVCADQQLLCQHHGAVHCSRWQQPVLLLLLLAATTAGYIGAPPRAQLLMMPFRLACSKRCRAHVPPGARSGAGRVSGPIPASALATAHFAASMSTWRSHCVAVAALQLHTGQCTSLPTSWEELGRDDRRASGGAVKPGPLGKDVLNVWGSGVESAPGARLKQRCTMHPCALERTWKNLGCLPPFAGKGSRVAQGLLLSKRW
eukprot:355280-Chlamydomonas_euryale.AAC.7